MSRDATVLYEEFGRARQTAIELTDRYHDCRAGDPSRPVLWSEVVRQTEAARQLLERWLRSPQPGHVEAIAPQEPARPRELVTQR